MNSHTLTSIKPQKPYEVLSQAYKVKLKKGSESKAYASWEGACRFMIPKRYSFLGPNPEAAVHSLGKLLNCINEDALKNLSARTKYSIILARNS